MLSVCKPYLAFLPCADRLEVVDPETNIAFPKTMHIESKVRIPDMTLLGVGVRKVSFLKVKVYSIGFYADLSNPNLKVCWLHTSLTIHRLIQAADPRRCHPRGKARIPGPQHYLLRPH